MKSGKNNMFDSKHYIPILKWKRSEQVALKALEQEHKEYITPLIQFVMPKNKPDDELTDAELLADIVAKFENLAPEIPEKLIGVWGYSPIFVDISLLFTTPLKVKSLNVILRGGHKQGGIFVPVIYLNDDPKIKKIAFSLARENGNGICLRLICSDFANLTRMNQDIVELLSSSRLKKDNIDLLVDIKETGENDNKCVKYLGLSQNIPDLLKWRTFSFASGSFPEDLTECKLDEENFIPRIDWKSWKGQVDSKKLQRKPSFADYTVQHPIYNVSTQFFSPSASIKYTLEDKWLIMKGKKRKYEMYLAHAKLLSTDRHFYGEDFSYGDQYIAEKARHYNVYIKDKSIKGTGTPETWIRAGINHHLVLTARQISNLS